MCRTWCLVVCLWLFSGVLYPVSAQRYSVRSYNVEDGLIQSQAIAMAQDSAHHLWIATLGGVSRFDSRRFTNFTTADGLISNYTTALLIDKRQRVWIGSQRGLTIYNGKRFTNFRLYAANANARVSSLVQTGDNKIWALFGGRIFNSEGNHIDSIALPHPEARITCLGKDASGELLAVVLGHGLYRYKKGIWEVLDNGIKSGFDQALTTQIYTTPAGKVWLLGTKGLFQYNKLTGVFPYHGLQGKGLPQQVLSMYEEKDGYFWLGTYTGVCRVQQDTISYFGVNNGFSNQPIMCIMKDIEGGIWLGTNSGGIQRFSDDHLKFYDQVGKLSYTPGMGFGRDLQKRLWTGTYGGGVVVLEKNQVKEIPVPSPVKSAQIINFTMADKAGRIWVGTNGGGIWRVDNGRMINISEKYQLPDPAYYCATVNKEGIVYLGTGRRVYQYDDKNGMQALPEVSGYIVALDASKKDTVLIGTGQGAYYYTNGKYLPYPSNLVSLATASVGSIVAVGNRVFLGTSEHGLFIDPDGKGTHIKNISTKEGLSSNTIYSMVLDRSNTLWIATGYFINRLSFTNDTLIKSIRLYGKSEGINAAEGNQNGAFEDEDGSIWIGTSKGAYHIYPQLKDPEPVRVPVFLKNVLLFSQPVQNHAYYDSLAGYYPVPVKLKLPHKENHLTFEFQGIRFSGQEALRYEYYVQGMEPGFSSPSPATSVIYSAIPPGTYTFKVRAVDENGKALGNTLSFPFEITAPFYATAFFRILVVVFLILLGVLIQWWRNRIKVGKQKMIEKLRTEEQYKVRKKTAEDFHDEMGNKLTRISILTDIARTKLGDNTEVLKLIGQIRDNAMTLYNGTKDIIWSLNPESDNLEEVLIRIKEFAIELFQETDIDLHFNTLPERVGKMKLPIDFSRNIMMICKESLNNILKHASASRVDFTVSTKEEGVLQIRIKDNGKGFDTRHAQSGHGIDNMHIRARRINALIQVVSDPENGGTCITIDMKIPL